ncbi:MAG: GC-type dockerin domain-anchored protein [Phycisphaerales bacterium]|nr:immunoglobulin domain-containing protein [Phycisphaeraceae bacterium]
MRTISLDFRLNPKQQIGAALLLLLLTGNAVQAQIVYSGVRNISIPLGTGSPTQRLYIGLQELTTRTGNTTVAGDDLTLSANSTATGINSFITVGSIAFSGTNSVTFNNAAGFPPNIRPIESGVLIGPGTYPSASGGTIGVGTPNALPLYQNQTRFIGFRVRGTTTTTFNYGWLRLEVGDDFQTSRLVDFALQTTPNTPIAAGEGIVVVPPFFDVTSSPSPLWQVTGTSVVFTGAAIADAACGTISYQWQRNGVNVVNGSGGASSGGGTVFNATTPSLVITDLALSDAGSYSLVATTPSCGTRTSSSASLVVYPANVWRSTLLGPAGSTQSWSYGITGSTQQAGEATFSGLARAVLTNGAGGTWTNLHPTGLPANSTSSARGLAPDQIVGITSIPNPFPLGTQSVATLWARSGELWSWNNLNPSPPAVAAPASFSIAKATDGNQQVGSATVGGQQLAALWSGSAESFVSLNPVGSIQSEANAVRNGQQAGSSFIGGQQRAGLWNGTAESWISLHPAGATTSVAMGTDGTAQVGYANISGGPERASLWNGTAESWISLHPASMSSSRAIATAGGTQVGSAAFFGSGMAAIWNGTASSWVNLHAYLPPGFIRSQAESIWRDGESTFISGVAVSASTQLPVGVMWTNCIAAGIALQPAPISTCVGAEALFNVTASGTPTFTHLWQWRVSPLSDWLPILNGVNTDPQGSANSFTASGAGTASLSLTGTSGSGWEVRSILFNACGSATSEPATLTLIPCQQPCSPADIANTDGETARPFAGPDGAIDNGDFTAFFAAFFLEEGDPGRLVADIANTDGETILEGSGPDGVVDNGDFTAFFSYFFDGCPTP